MVWYLLPAGVFTLACAFVAFVLWRAIPRVRVIDVRTIAREREATKKQQIVFARAERLRADTARRVGAVLKPVLTNTTRAWRAWYTRITELEKRYRHVGAVQQGDTPFDPVRTAFDEALVFVREGKTREAEQALVRVINLSPKHTKAYEELGRLYMRTQQWDEAKEAFAFLLKLDPNDVSAHADIGELAMARGEVQAAIVSFRHAVERKGGNAQLLALLLDALIEAGEKEEALKIFARLKDIAPQFPKLASFEERLRTVTMKG